MSCVYVFKATFWVGIYLTVLIMYTVGRPQRHIAHTYTHTPIWRKARKRQKTEKGMKFTIVYRLDRIFRKFNWNSTTLRKIDKTNRENIEGVKSDNNSKGNIGAWERAGKVERKNKSFLVIKFNSCSLFSLLLSISCSYPTLLIVCDLHSTKKKSCARSFFVKLSSKNVLNSVLSGITTHYTYIYTQE